MINETVAEQQDKTEQEKKINDIVDTYNHRRDNIKYFSLDYPIRTIAEMFKKKELYKPEYQRNNIWSIDMKTNLIESLVLGLPVPYIFGAFDKESGKIEIIDGLQRVSAITDFLGNKFKLSSNGLEEFEILAGYNFSELPSKIQTILQNTSVKLIVLDDKLNDIDSYATKFMIFKRVNTTGAKLSDMELRKGLYRETSNFLSEVTGDKTFKSICTKYIQAKEERMESEELALRFFAYSNDLANYKSNAFEFLTNYARDLNNELLEASADDKKEKLIKDFNLMCSFVKKYLPNSFRVTKNGKHANQISRVRFESVAVGVILALRKKSDITLNSDIFENDKNYNDLVSKPNTSSTLKERIEYVTNKLINA